ncbi:MAG: thiolase family protein, partial [Deltaproteobacteria bacterium]
MKEAVIVDGIRTPTGRAHAEKGWLRTVPPDELLGTLYKAIFDRNKAVKPEDIEGVFIGCANLTGPQNSIARLSWLAHGFPECVPQNNIEMQCASAMAAIQHCARAIIANEGDIYIAGGVEDMMRVGMGAGMEFPAKLGERYNPMELPMGPTAEKVAEKYNISREDQEKWALASHQKAGAARDAGKFKNEIVPIEVTYEDGSKKVIDSDQNIRPDTSLEKMATMAPAFKPDGVVTAATSSPLNQGASLLLLMSRDKADKLGVSYTLRYKAGAQVGVDPTMMGIGPIDATNKALKRAGLTVDDIDVVEINEAFASQSLASLRELNIPLEKANLWGGAMALGHPLGSSGCRITVTLNSIMKTDKTDA